MNAVLDHIVHLCEIWNIVRRDYHGLNTRTISRHGFLFEAADRQNTAQQRDFPGHRHIMADRDIA